MLARFLLSKYTSKLNSFFKNAVWSEVTWLFVIIHVIIYLNLSFIYASYILIKAKFFYKDKSIKLLTNKRNTSVYCRDNNFMMNIIQSIKWFFLLKHIEFDNISTFSSTLQITLYFPTVRKDLSPPCLLDHISIQSLRPSMTLALASSHEMLFSLDLGSLVKRGLSII